MIHPLLMRFFAPRHPAHPVSGDSEDSTVYCSTLAGVPGGLLGYPRAYYISFREFNSHRVRILVWTFSFEKMISGKRESVS